MPYPCPNKASQSWKDLVNQYGEIGAYKRWSDETIKAGVGTPEGLTYTFKAVEGIFNNKAKVEKWFEQIKDKEQFWNKVQKDLGVPKEQVELMKQTEGKNVDDILFNFIEKYGFETKIKTATELLPKNMDSFDYEQAMYNEYREPDFYQNETGGVSMSESVKVPKADTEKPTQHYSNLTVPGGTNYTENEISTPAITPSIKGHAQFSTDNGIGWFRSDEQAKTYYDSEVGEYLVETKSTGDLFEDAFGTNKKVIPTTTKTRRILEVQSDLFQKGKEKSDLVNNRSNFEYTEVSQKELDESHLKGKFIIVPNSEYKWYDESTGENRISKINGYEYNGNIYVYKNGSIPSIIKEVPHKQNQFLQLLNKDQNWITFFIHSIIQDSAKKGYEKVLFPRGETAAKVEGHETLANELNRINRQIEELNNQKNNLPKKGTTKAITFDEQGYTIEEREIDSIEKIDNTIKELEQKKQELKSQGIEKLKPIESFYENRVGNILKKNYDVKEVTDEYGNQWNEITLKEEHKQPVRFFSHDTHIDKLTNGSPELISFVQEKFQQLYPEVQRFYNKDKFREFVETHGGTMEDIDRIGGAFKNAVHIDPNSPFQAVMFHEYSHLYWDAIADTDPLKREFREHFGWNESMSQEQTDNIDEQIIREITDAGTKLTEGELRHHSFYERFLDLLKRFWKQVRDMFGGKKASTIDSLADHLANEIWNNKRNFTAKDFDKTVIRNLIYPSEDSLNGGTAANSTDHSQMVDINQLIQSQKQTISVSGTAIDKRIAELKNLSGLKGISLKITDDLREKVEKEINQENFYKGKVKTTLNDLNHAATNMFEAKRKSEQFNPGEVEKFKAHFESESVYEKYVKDHEQWLQSIIDKQGSNFVAFHTDIPIGDTDLVVKDITPLIIELKDNVLLVVDYQPGLESTKRIDENGNEQFSESYLKSTTNFKGSLSNVEESLYNEHKIRLNVMSDVLDSYGNKVKGIFVKPTVFEVDNSNNKIRSIKNEKPISMPRETKDSELILKHIKNVVTDKKFNDYISKEKVQMKKYGYSDFVIQQQLTALTMLRSHGFNFNEPSSIQLGTSFGLLEQIKDHFRSRGKTEAEISKLDFEELLSPWAMKGEQAFLNPDGTLRTFDEEDVTGIKEMEEVFRERIKALKGGVTPINSDYEYFRNSFSKLSDELTKLNENLGGKNGYENLMILVSNEKQLKQFWTKLQSLHPLVAKEPMLLTKSMLAFHNMTAMMKEEISGHDYKPCIRLVAEMLQSEEIRNNMFRSDINGIARHIMNCAHISDKYLPLQFWGTKYSETLRKIRADETRWEAEIKKHKNTKVPLTMLYSVDKGKRVLKSVAEYEYDNKPLTKRQLKETQELIEIKKKNLESETDAVKKKTLQKDIARLEKSLVHDPELYKEGLEILHLYHKLYQNYYDNYDLSANVPFINIVKTKKEFIEELGRKKGMEWYNVIKSSKYDNIRIKTDDKEQMTLRQFKDSYNGQNLSEFKKLLRKYEKQAIERNLGQHIDDVYNTVDGERTIPVLGTSKISHVSELTAPHLQETAARLITSYHKRNAMPLMDWIVDKYPQREGTHSNTLDYINDLTNANFYNQDIGLGKDMPKFKKAASVIRQFVSANVMMGSILTQKQNLLDGQITNLMYHQNPGPMLKRLLVENKQGFLKNFARYHKMMTEAGRGSVTKEIYLDVYNKGLFDSSKLTEYGYWMCERIERLNQTPMFIHLLRAEEDAMYDQEGNLKPGEKGLSQVRIDAIFRELDSYNGGYSPESAAPAFMGTLGKMSIVFKRWLPEFYQRYFGGTFVDRGGKIQVPALTNLWVEAKFLSLSLSDANREAKIKEINDILAKNPLAHLSFIEQKIFEGKDKSKFDNAKSFTSEQMAAAKTLAMTSALLATYLLLGGPLLNQNKKQEDDLTDINEPVVWKDYFKPSLFNTLQSVLLPLQLMNMFDTDTSKLAFVTWCGNVVKLIMHLVLQDSFSDKVEPDFFLKGEGKKQWPYYVLKVAPWGNAANQAGRIYGRFTVEQYELHKKEYVNTYDAIIKAGNDYYKIYGTRPIGMEPGIKIKSKPGKMGPYQRIPTNKNVINITYDELKSTPWFKALVKKKGKTLSEKELTDAKKYKQIEKWMKDGTLQTRVENAQHINKDLLKVARKDAESEALEEGPSTTPVIQPVTVSESEKDQRRQEHMNAMQKRMEERYKSK